jgi:hypothetical protein
MAIIPTESICLNCVYWYKDGECPECHGKGHCFWDGKDAPVCQLPETTLKDLIEGE